MYPNGLKTTRYAAVIVLLILACIPVLAQGSEPAKESQPITPPSYTESISGTLVKFDMIAVPGGEITLPDPSKPGEMRKVVLKPFWIGKTEVTWDEFDVYYLKLDEPGTSNPACDAVSRPSRCYFPVDKGFGHKGYPVINVSFLAAESYCKWLSAKTGKKYRLPTEAEWEYACRAGKPEPDPASLAACAWFGQEKTQPVAKKSPNAWGIYDMLGNVGEYCTTLDGKPVLCGGCYDDPAEKISPRARKYPDPSWQMNDPQDPKSKWWLTDGPFAGFRVVRVE